MSTLIMSTEESQVTCRSSPRPRNWIQFIWIVRISKRLGIGNSVFRDIVRIAVDTRSVELAGVNEQEQVEYTRRYLQYGKAREL
jgi:hypothetical protein